MDELKVMEEVIKCELCEVTVLDEYNANMYGWNWYRGYLKRTFHYCSGCKYKKESIEKLRLSKIKPAEKNT